MFAEVCSKIRETVYAITITSHNAITLQGKWSVCTAFMISPGVLVTAAHPFEEHSSSTMKAEAIEASCLKYNGTFEATHLLAKDTVRDIALLQFHVPKSDFCVVLEPQPVPIGSFCGAIGFPHPKVNKNGKGGLNFNLIERFQGQCIAAHYSGLHESGQSFQVYETDTVMYGGSSGCPGFLEDGRVFGMHLKSCVDDTNPGFSLWLSAKEIVHFADANSIKF